MDTKERIYGGGALGRLSPVGVILAARPLLAVTMLVASAGLGLGLAAPANAGCETKPTHQYCDLPMRPDGTWDRCRIIFGKGVGGISGHRKGEVRCYPMNPTLMPYTGEPRHYIP